MNETGMQVDLTIFTLSDIMIMQTLQANKNFGFKLQSKESTRTSKVSIIFFAQLLNKVLIEERMHLKDSWS